MASSKPYPTMGCGIAGALAAELHAIERNERETEAHYRRAVRQDLDELADAVGELSARCELLILKREWERVKRWD